MNLDINYWKNYNIYAIVFIKAPKPNPKKRKKKKKEKKKRRRMCR